MAQYYLEYILQRNGDSFIIVMFHTKQSYNTRVFLVENASDEEPLFKEIKSEKAERYRDGGTTYIKTECGTICLPFRGEHVFAPPDVNVDELTSPILNIFGRKRSTPGEPITIIYQNGGKIANENKWFQNIKKFVEDNDCEMECF